MNREPADKTSVAWKSWALAQMHPNGLPVYKLDWETYEVTEANY